jgi:putative ABC transport system substrate-binding protein
MKRRAVLVAAAAWPSLIWAGEAVAQAKPPVLIGWLNTGSRVVSGQRLATFKDGMAQFGWKDGSNYVVEERWADGQYARLQVLAEELAAKKPALVVAATLRAVTAAARALPNTPVVQASGGDPAGTGLVKTLARPGGMVTGVTNIVGVLSEKYLELLLATVPKARRIGFLFDSGSAVFLARHKENAGHSIARYSVDARFAEAARPDEIGPAISNLATEGVQALIVMPSPLFSNERQRIVRLALDHRWPVISDTRVWVEMGALLSYGHDIATLYRRAAYYVDRILKGAQPADLPIEQPTKLEFAVNLKTAKALGITIPQTVLLRADTVIE